MTTACRATPNCQSGVLPVTPAETDAVSQTLAAAFQDDPVFTWIVPNSEARRTHLPGWFAVVVGALVDHRASHQTDSCTAAALWVPPEAEPMTTAQSDRLIEVTAAVGADEVGRLGVLMEEMESCHPHEPHHYLWFLGVTPDNQGHGLGTRLLAAYLSVLDEHGQSAYLEATSPDNRRLYERHGFEVTGVISAAGSPPLWAMWREPR